MQGTIVCRKFDMQGILWLGIERILWWGIK